jgi:hypothetical protein
MMLALASGFTFHAINNLTSLVVIRWLVISNVLISGNGISLLAEAMA